MMLSAEKVDRFHMQRAWKSRRLRLTGSVSLQPNAFLRCEGPAKPGIPARNEPPDKPARAVGGADGASGAVHSDGVNTKVFAARYQSGSNPGIKHNATAVSGTAAPLWMRVSRTGDQWSQTWSTDGATWTQGASFTHALTVSSTGVFAGNAGPNPAHTAIIDHFDNTAAPS